LASLPFFVLSSASSTRFFFRIPFTGTASTLVRLVYSYRCFFRIPLLDLLLLSSASRLLGSSSAFPLRVLLPSLSSTRIFYSPSVRSGNILQFQGHLLLHQLEDHNYRLPSLQLRKPLTGHPSSSSRRASYFQLIRGLLLAAE